MNFSSNLPHRSIFKGRYSASREETKFPIGIKTGFGKINICSQTVTVLKSYLRQREGSAFSAIGKKKTKKGKITSNGADGVNFQSCVWESSIQIPLTNIGVGGSDSYSAGFKNNRFTFLQFHLFLTCPWRHSGSSLPGWHLHNSTAPNVPFHSGQGSSSSKQRWKHVKIDLSLCIAPMCLWMRFEKGPIMCSGFIHNQDSRTDSVFW